MPCLPASRSRPANRSCMKSADDPARIIFLSSSSSAPCANGTHDNSNTASNPDSLVLWLVRVKICPAGLTGTADMKNGLWMAMFQGQHMPDSLPAGSRVVPDVSGDDPARFARCHGFPAGPAGHTGLTATDAGVWKNARNSRPPARRSLTWIKIRMTRRNKINQKQGAVS